VISVYIAVADSSAQTLKQSRLNQEMSAIMNVMTNDIRRAGYWVSAGANLPHENPYMAFDATDHDAKTNALQVRDSSANVFISDQASGSCIIYTYDTNEDANTTVESVEHFGFRWFGSETDPLQMKIGGTVNTCGDSNNDWQPVNDTKSIKITGLTFDLGNSTCINSSEPDDVEDGGDASVVDDAIEYNCFTVTPDSGEVLTIVREVAITLNAKLANDDLVKASMNQTVRVRNDLVRKQP
jgi:hypothetical protein